MITQVKLENLPSYELGMERGVEKGMDKGIDKGMALIIEKLLKTQTPEQVAQLTELPLEKIIALNNNRLES